MNWAYSILGWGGYWGWDPVENASLLPWITATAFLHSVMMQEKKGMMKVWNMVLVSATFWLPIFGTTLTRTGMAQSVHAFGNSPLGPYFYTLLAVGIAATVWLILSRLDYLKSESATGKRAVARIQLHVQQPGSAGVVLRDPVGHLVPGNFGSDLRHQSHGWEGILQPHQRADGAVPITADGHRTADRMAQELGGEPEARVSVADDCRSMRRRDSADRGRAEFLRVDVADAVHLRAL